MASGIFRYKKKTIYNSICKFIKEKRKMNYLLDALCKKLEGEIAVAHANIKTYERNSIGIGEHPELVQAIETQVEIIAHAEDKLNVINNHFG